jgi:hypothetical protein
MLGIAPVVPEQCIAWVYPTPAHHDVQHVQVAPGDPEDWVFEDWVGVPLSEAAHQPNIQIPNIQDVRGLL